MSDIDKMILAMDNEIAETEFLEKSDNPDKERLQKYSDYFLERTACVLQKLLTKND